MTRVAAMLMLAASGLPIFLSPLAAAADGPPNLTGTWSNYPGPSAATTPPNPRWVAPPATPLLLKPQFAGPYEAKRAAQRESDKRGQPIATAGTECIPYGMPQMMFPIYPMEILQTKGQITIIAEVFGQVRRIYIDEPQLKIEDVPPLFNGHSVGHWEGATLVVDTIGVKEEVLGHADIPHSGQMHIKERFHLVTPDILHDEITIDDPVTLEKPWTFTFAYKRLPGYQMMEYICENNRSYVDDKGVTHMKLQDH